jgi:hypothetical protein
MVFTQPASSTGSGGTSVGAFISGAAENLGKREVVELVDKGGLLAGWPAYNLIKLITIYAPGCDSSHLIIREIELPDGGKSLLLSAPSSLLDKTLRATIYVKHTSTDLVLLEYIRDRWERRKPQLLSITGTVDSKGASQDTLLAFPVEGIGSYWLLENNASDLVISPPTSKAVSASSSPWTDRIYRGLLPWGWSILLLVVGWTISHWIHKTERQDQDGSCSLSAGRLPIGPC